MSPLGCDPCELPQSHYAADGLPGDRLRRTTPLAVSSRMFPGSQRFLYVVLILAVPSFHMPADNP